MHAEFQASRPAGVGGEWGDGDSRKGGTKCFYPIHNEISNSFLASLGRDKWFKRSTKASKLSSSHCKPPEVWLAWDNSLQRQPERQAPPSCYEHGFQVA